MGERTRVSHLFVFVKKSDAFLYFAAICSTGVIAALNPIMSILLGQIFDLFTQFSTGIINADGLNMKIRPYLFGFIGLGGTAFTCSWAFIFLWMFIGELQSFRARSQVLRTLIGTPISWFDLQDEGKAGLCLRIYRQLEDFQIGNSQPLGFVVQSLLTCVFSLGVALWKSWSLTLVILASTPFVVTIAALCSRRCQTHIENEKLYLSEASSVVQRVAEAINTVKAFNAEAQEYESFGEFTLLALNAYTKLARVIAIQQGLIRFFVLAMFVQGFWFGTFLLRKNMVAPGDILTVFYSCLTAVESLSNLSPQVIVLEKGKSAGQSLVSFQHDNLQYNKRYSETSDKPPRSCRGDIEFKNVTFSYPGRKELALDDVTLFIPAGEITFIVGKSGSGKSTIGLLLTKVYDTSCASIRIDNHNLENLKDDWLRANITLVQQAGSLFDTSVEGNIRMGNNNRSNLPLWVLEEACDSALLHDTLLDLTEGLQTIVGDSGRNLSGGQRQRIGLARAYIRDTPILILGNKSESHAKYR